MTTTYKEYSEERKTFFEKHDNDYCIYTSSLDEYNRYTKVYQFIDGAVWYELMTPVIETKVVEICKVNVEVEVKLLKTEYWSSESESKYYYEKY